MFRASTYYSNLEAAISLRSIEEKSLRGYSENLYLIFGAFIPLIFPRYYPENLGSNSPGLHRYKLILTLTLPSGDANAHVPF